ncbi:MAG: hypothetical protein QM765_19140 [Myxococcales bacterium]
MASSDIAEALIDSLAGLEVGTTGDVAAAKALSRLDPVEAVHALRVLVGKAKASPRAGKALVLATRALSWGPDEFFSPEARGRVFDAATEFGVAEVAALFARSAPALEVDPTLIDQPDPVIGQLTLGHKKMLARKVDGDRIARFAMEPDARVIRELLFNPRLTEELVVRIAARRPARVPVLMEIWRARKWCVNRNVCRALAMNPYTPPEIGLKILPQLSRADLGTIAGDGALHDDVRAMAQKLMGPSLRSARRPLDRPAEQVPEPGEAAGQHHQHQDGGEEEDLVGGEVEARHRRS